MTEGSRERCPACGAPLRPDLFLVPVGDDAPYADDTGSGSEPVSRAPPAARRRGMLAAGALGLAVLTAAGLGLTALGSRSPDAEPAADRDRATTSTLPTTTTTVLGPLLPAATGLELVVIRGDHSLRLVDLDTGHLTEIPARVGEPFQAMAIDGHVVIAGPGGLRVYPLDSRAPPRRLGSARRVFPSTTEGHLWVERDTLDGEVILIEIDLDGVHQRDPVRLPRIAGVRDVTSAGVLLDVAGQSLLVDPRDGTARGLGEGLVLAVHGETAARFSCGTELQCGLSIGALDGSAGRAVPLPADTTVDTWGAAFSPDGRTLTVQLFTDRPGAFSHLALIDVASARVVGSFDVPSFPPAWSPSGEWLFLTRLDRIVAVRRSGTPAVDVLVAGPPPQQVVVLER